MSESSIFNAFWTEEFKFTILMFKNITLIYIILNEFYLAKEKIKLAISISKLKYQKRSQIHKTMCFVKIE